MARGEGAGGKMAVVSRPAPGITSEGPEGRETATVGTFEAGELMRVSSGEGEEGTVLASEAGSAGEGSSECSSAV